MQKNRKISNGKIGRFLECVSELEKIFLIKVTVKIL